MKKFLLLALFAVLGMAQQAFAQLSVTCDGTEINNGDVVTFDAIEDDDTGDIVAGHATDPLFRAPEGTNLTVTVTIPNAAGQSFLWCGITTACETANPGKNTRSYTFKKGLMPGVLDFANMNLHADFHKGEYATYSVKVDVAVNGQQERTFFLVYKYAEVEAGIEGVEGQTESVKFADHVCHYSFSTAAPRALQVYGMDGKLVQYTALAAAEGSVSLSAMQKGAYVYSVIENGKQVKAGKFLVK